MSALLPAEIPPPPQPTGFATLPAPAATSAGLAAAGSHDDALGPWAYFGIAAGVAACVAILVAACLYCRAVRKVNQLRANVQQQPQAVPMIAPTTTMTAQALVSTAVAPASGAHASPLLRHQQPLPAVPIGGLIRPMHLPPPPPPSNSSSYVAPLPPLPVLRTANAAAPATSPPSESCDFESLREAILSRAPGKGPVASPVAQSLLRHIFATSVRARSRPSSSSTAAAAEMAPPTSTRHLVAHNRVFAFVEAPVAKLAVDLQSDVGALVHHHDVPRMVLALTPSNRRLDLPYDGTGSNTTGLFAGTQHLPTLAFAIEQGALHGARVMAHVVEHAVDALVTFAALQLVPDVGLDRIRCDIAASSGAVHRVVLGVATTASNSNGADDEPDIVGPLVQFLCALSEALVPTSDAGAKAVVTRAMVDALDATSAHDVVRLLGPSHMVAASFRRHQLGDQPPLAAADTLPGNDSRVPKALNTRWNLDVVARPASPNSVALQCVACSNTVTSDSASNGQTMHGLVCPSDDAHFVCATCVVTLAVARGGTAASAGAIVCPACDNLLGDTHLIAADVEAVAVDATVPSTLRKRNAALNDVLASSDADLLVRLFTSAAQSPRAHVLLCPKPPPQVFPTDSTARLHRLKGLGSVADIMRGAVADPASRPLAHWLVSDKACAAAIVQISAKDRLAQIPSTHQFIVARNAPATRDAAFKKLKAAHGTKFAFHGSRTECWFAILNGGIKNCSGTSLQTTGAAKGPGIYLATQASTAFAYCHPCPNWHLPSNAPATSTAAAKQHTSDALIRDNGALVVLALCEVVKDGISDHTWCWTVADENRVAVRCLFVLERGAGTRLQVDIASDKTLQADVRKLTAKYT